MLYSPCIHSAIAGVAPFSLAVVPAAIAQDKHHHQHRVSCHHVTERQVGKAMVHGERFDGRTMANGHIFDMSAATAASRTLPLGTRARVTNVSKRRSTDVTIRDRGRLRAKHAILDLSQGAARAIGRTEREGVAPVVIEPVGCDATARPARAAAPAHHEVIRARQ